MSLLDLPRLTNQLAALERRAGSGGKDTVDHPRIPGAKDDVANAACEALLMVRSMKIVPRAEKRERPPLRELLKNIGKW